VQTLVGLIAKRKGTIVFEWGPFIKVSQSDLTSRDIAAIILRRVVAIRYPAP
jgi:hypothetical protein